jgi:CRP-like cAMP-binding protein
MKDFKLFVENYTSISGNEWDKISTDYTQQKIAKNEMILQEGMICRNFYFLESGLLRYFYNSEGKEVVKTFTFPPYCFTSEASFINQRPAIENIQAIEDSIVWKIGYKQYNELEKLNSWKKFTNGLLDEIDTFSKLMIIHLKTQSPEQRYFWLIHNYPQAILQRISQKDLASFLGITPQSFCRIKNNLHKNRKVNLSE